MSEGRRFTTVEEQVEYGLDTIPPGDKVSVSLRELMYVHQAMGELVRFFHQPLHWQTQDDVSRFMGTSESGALHVISKSYYEHLRKMVPSKFDHWFEAGRFVHPDFPYYYAENQDEA